MRRLPLWVALAGVVAAGCSTVNLGDPPADVNACRPSQDFFANGGMWDMFLDKDYGGKAWVKILADVFEAYVACVILSDHTGAHIHLQHISSAQSVDIIRRAKQRGIRITA